MEGKRNSSVSEELCCGACGAVWNACACHPGTCETLDNIPECIETGIVESKPQDDANIWLMDYEWPDKFGPIY